MGVVQQYREEVLLGREGNERCNGIGEAYAREEPVGGKTVTDRCLCWSGPDHPPKLFYLLICLWFVAFDMRWIPVLCSHLCLSHPAGPCTIMNNYWKYQTWSSK